MKISIFDENRQFATDKSSCSGLFIEEAFIELGHEVFTNEFVDADFALVIRGEHEPLREIFEEHPKCALWYWEPPFWGWFDNTVELCKEYNVPILVSNEGILTAFKNKYDYDNVHVVQQAFNPRVHKPIKCKKKYDVCYIGTSSPARSDLMSKLQRDLPNLKFYLTGRGYGPEVYNEEFSETVCQAKVCLELPPETSPNWQGKWNEHYSVRLFLVMGAGGYLLMPENESLQDQFNYRFLTHNSYEQLKDAIEHLCSKDMNYVRTKATKSMHKQALEGHTYVHRCKQILEIIK